MAERAGTIADGSLSTLAPEMGRGNGNSLIQFVPSSPLRETSRAARLAALASRADLREVWRRRKRHEVYIAFRQQHLSRSRGRDPHGQDRGGGGLRFGDHRRSRGVSAQIHLGLSL